MNSKELSIITNSKPRFLTPDGKTVHVEKTGLVIDGSKLISSPGSAYTAPVVYGTGKKVAVGYHSGQVRVFRPDRCTFEVYKPHEDDVTCVDFSPDGTKLVTTGFDNRVVVFDIRSGKELLKFKVEYPTKVIFSKDSTKLFVENGRGVFSAHDARTGRTIGTTAFNTWFRHREIKISPDGRWLTMLAVEDDRNRRFAILDANTLEETISFNNISRHYSAAEFSPCGKLIVFSDEHDKTCWTVSVWSISPKETKAVLKGHTMPVEVAAFSPDGKLLATASRSETIIWRAEDWKSLKTIPFEWTTKIVFSGNSKRMLICSNRDKSALWEISNPPKPKAQVKVGDVVVSFPEEFDDYVVEIDPASNTVDIRKRKAEDEGQSSKKIKK